MVKYCQNKLKFHLVVVKDRGNTWEKNQEKKSAVFLAIFLKVSVFTGLTSNAYHDKNSCWMAGVTSLSLELVLFFDVSSCPIA